MTLLDETETESESGDEQVAPLGQSGSLRIAFASTDRLHVDMHFGAAERLVVFDVTPGRADLVGVARFLKAEMKGENKERGQIDQSVVADMVAADAEVPVIVSPPEDKVIGKLDYIDGCAAVYAVSIGSSSIKRLMALGIQPVVVGNGHEILDLLNEVSLALVHGGLSWVTRAAAKAGLSRVETADNVLPFPKSSADNRRLITSIDE